MAIRRSELQRILSATLQPGSLHLGKSLKYFEDRGPDVRAHFDDGTEARGRLLIGADGLRSAVRRQLFPHVSLRYSGQTCFRGLAAFRMPEELRQTAWEVWGGAARFGFSAVDPERVYWFAPLKAPAGQQWDPGDASRRLRETYASFPEPIPAIISATPADALIQNDLYDFPPIKQWHRGNVLLIGDAAHATTPNLGQGGAQAMEDALSLALKLEAHGPRSRSACPG
jgi:2-polyprenyl-6-methoxyphenol hydroxylase-like FAD-dependent oxidoreductase